MKPTKAEQFELNLHCEAVDFKYQIEAEGAQYVLYSLLKYTSFTKARIGKLLGVSECFISFITNGQRKMSLKVAIRLADLLKMNLGEKVKLYERLGE